MPLHSSWATAYATGSTLVYLTCSSAKLDSIEAMRALIEHRDVA